MRIGILTFHGSHNYGAMLQAYATQQFLKSRTDAEVKIIDYQPDSVRYDYKIIKRPKGLKDTVKLCIKLLKYKRVKKKWNGFEHFLENRFDKTRPYSTYEDLKAFLPDCDLIIVGSDQVFNPRNKNKRVYYLEFISDSRIRRAAYAPSFGFAQIPENEKTNVKNALKKIEFLSARELEGCAIIKQLTGRTVDCVLDPVFLLSSKEWLRRLSHPFEKPFEGYILVYALVGFKDQMAVARQVKRYLNLPIVMIPGQNEPPPLTGADIILSDTCPIRFIHLFANADYVITDSFHGTSFSMIFNKPFFSTIVNHDTSSRITSLLNKLGLSRRVLFSPRKIEKRELALDFDKANRLLDREISLSIKYLEGVTSLGES